MPAEAPVVALPPGLALVRFFSPARGGWATQRAYGPLADMRFDHHPLPCRLHADRSVWYSAESLRGAVAESFGRRGMIERSGIARLVLAKVLTEIRVLDLVGVAARAFGLTQEIAATTDYAACQQWAQAFYDQYPRVDGIRWRGRQSGSLCVALTDRAEMDSLKGQTWALADPAIWRRISRAARDCHLTIV